VIPQAVGIRFDKVGLWVNHDMILWTDASLRIALSFMYANKGFVYTLQLPPPGRKIDIFFLELVAIMSAIHHAGSLSQPPCHLLVWTDSLDTVGVLNSLHATESLHNAPLLAITQVILCTGMDLHICHIEGKRNVRADMLSCLLLDKYQRKFPADHVHFFTPPWDLFVA